MYQIYCDDSLLYDPRVQELAVIDPVLQLELNSAGRFTLTLPPEHPGYDSPAPLLSRIRVLQDGEELFKGRVLELETDFFKRKRLLCEGELAFLNDSVQRPGEYHNATVRGYLSTLLEAHNSQVEEDKQFELGMVTVTDSNDSLYRYTNYNSTWEELKADLVDDLGGYLRVRNVYAADGSLSHRYLDYVTLEDYGSYCTQTVEFGENLVELCASRDATDFATVLIPLGATLEEETEYSHGIAGLNERLTIQEQTGGVDYVENEEAIAQYGRIVKVVEWDGVTLSSNLLKKARAYLAGFDYDSLSLEARAVDLHFTDESFAALRLGDRLRVLSAPHGLDALFPLCRMTLYLTRPGENRVSLGTTVVEGIANRTATLSSSLVNTQNSVTAEQRLLNQAKENATALINAATAAGYVVVDENEILIMDNPDKTLAQRVWRWNAGGLGYSSTGYEGTFGLAMTMDGAIVADFITSGVMSAERVLLGGPLTVYTDESGTCIGGYLCYLTGRSDTGETLGVGVMDSTQTNYLIATTEGVRLSAGDSHIYALTDGGVVLSGSNATLSGGGTLSLNGDILLNTGKQLYFDEKSLVGLSEGGFFAGHPDCDTYLRGKALYLQGTAWSSDRRQKHSIRPLAERAGYAELLRRLRPVEYVYKGDTEGRLRLGYLAQEVQEAAQSLGLPPALSLVQEDGAGQLWLDYMQLIPLLQQELVLLRQELAQLKEACYGRDHRLSE